tara:strand:- start:155 stop:2038 length:1884 start_codon:yes stop_codon:yes gene_type:complete
MAAGIGIGYSEISYKSWAVFTMGILIAAFLTKKINQRTNLQHLLYFMFLFLQLGFFSFKTKQEKPNHSLKKGVYQIQCEIIELQEGDKKWNKGTAKIQQIFKENERPLVCYDKLLFYTDKQTSFQLKPGDIVLIKSQIQKISNKGNPGEFDAAFYWGTKGINYMSFFTESDYSKVIDVEIRMKNALKSGIVKNLKRYVPKKHLGIVKALFLGDKSSLEQETRYSFSAAGAMHLLAISGLHIGLFIWIIYGFLRLFSRFIKRNTALLFAFLFIWLYAYLIDFPPSVLRSVLMFSILSLGYFNRGIKNQLNILLFAATGMLLIDPMYLFDIGYQLSYSAMLGIILCYGTISKSYQSKFKLLNFFWGVTALCLSAQLFTFPICLYYFHQFPNYFVLSNLGIVIFAGTIVGLGGALIIFSQVAFLAEKTAFLLSILLTLLVTFIEWIENIPGALAKGFLLQNIELFTMLLCCFGLYWNLVYRKRLFISSIIGICMCAVISFNHNRQLSSNHLVLFNTNKFTSALHIKNVTYFFHDDLLPIKCHQLLSDYNKCYPGETHIINLKNSNITIASPYHKINFSRIENNLVLSVNNKSYDICYSQKDIIKLRHEKIGLAWVEGAKIRLNEAYFFNF